MTAAAVVFWASAAFIVGYGPAYVLTLILRDRRDRREEARLQAEEDKRADEEWAAVVAAVDADSDLIYQQMCFERWESEL